MDLPIWFTNGNTHDEEIFRDLLGSEAQKFSEVDKSQPDVCEQVDALVHINSAEKADDLSDAFGRVRDRIFWIINNKGYYRYTSEEFSSFEEFLLERYTRMKNKANVTFLVNEFLPMLAQFGPEWAPEKLLTMRENYSKLLAAIPTARQAIDQLQQVQTRFEEQEKTIEENKAHLEHERRDLKPDDPEYERELSSLNNEIKLLEEDTKRLDKEKKASLQIATETFKKNIEQIVNVIADPSVPAWSKDGLDVGKILKQQETIQPAIDIIGGQRLEAAGKVVFVVTVPVRKSMLIEHALRNIIDFHVTDPGIVISLMEDEFFPKKGGRK